MTRPACDRCGREIKSNHRYISGTADLHELYLVCHKCYRAWLTWMRTPPDKET